MTNQALKILKMAKNPMESSGCYAIIKGLQKNPASKLELIDFTDIHTDKYFDEELEVFKSIFPDTVVKSGFELKKKPRVPLHPLKKLKNYIDKHQIKLIDLFNKFDSDGSLSVTKAQFIQGIRELGLNLTDDEHQVLVDELDADRDGEINYR
jgi:hypothetical protein